MITPQEAKNWLVSEGCVRCKENTSRMVYDAMLWDDDTVIIRPVTLELVPLNLISLEEFANYFGAIGDTE